VRGAYRIICLWSRTLNVLCIFTATRARNHSTMLTTSTVSQWICENLIGLGRPDPWVPDHLSCLSVMLVYCGQTAEWIKMKLGMEVCLGPGHIVLDMGKAASPNFRRVSVVAKRLDGSRCHLVRTYCKSRPRQH